MNSWFLKLARVFTLGCLLGSGAMTAQKAAAVEQEDADEIQPRTWAILIGVEKYEKAPPLQFTSNDVGNLADTLVTRGGILRHRILEMTDDQRTPLLQPTRQAMMSQLTDWLARPRSQDSIIVYFSGHGFRDESGKMYLAPRECDPANPTSTGIPVEWFRNQLATCQADFKLLILDACHAGSEKSVSPEGVDGQSLGATFEDLERVVTIASCRSSEKSLIWPDKQQSLFSYWLNQGLRGQADRQQDGKVDIHELYEFVYPNVTRTAQSCFNRPQTPVRIFRSGIAGVPVVLTLKPQSLDTVLNDIADQLADAMQQHRLSKVGIPEFLVRFTTPDGDEQDVLPRNSLGKYCAEQLDRMLQMRSAGRFQVVDRRRLQAALQSSRFQTKDFGSTDRLQSLAEAVDHQDAVTGRATKLTAVAIGSMVGRRGNLLRLQCELQQTDSDSCLGVSAGGTAELNASQWAMIGTSAMIRPEDHRRDEHTTTSTDSAIVDHVEQQQRPHPLKDPAFLQSFRITMVVDGQPRQGEFRGNDYFVPVKKGEKYKIVIESLRDEVVVMRLLVDGLNTLPEKEPSMEKGITTESWGQHVDLSKARSWVLDPAEVEGPRRWTVSGFVTKTGADGAWREFTVVDAQDSLAARQSFTDELGLITIALYKPAGSIRGGLGTGAGDTRRVDLTEHKRIDPGNLIAIVHLRYVDRQALESTR
ncbi:MAG: caspase family protein [Planctomycetes bacterium]|nr:caspase family protein [Planctomycetota bacterium]